MADRLAELLREKALMKGEFQLSSGGTSNVYVNAKHVTLHPEGAVLVARAILERIQALEGPIAGVGGPTIGADPMAGAVAALSHLEGQPIPGFLVRKEAKGHGTRAKLENAPPEGSKVVLVEDVVTTGGSTLKAAETIEAADLEIAAIISIVDRESGGAENLAHYNYQPLYTLTKLLQQP